MNDLIWFFGRGASISCGIDWQTPDEWGALKRDEKIKNIIDILQMEMFKNGIDTTPYKELLNILATKTNSNWRHYFITTNWDYLLQKEIQNLKFAVLPNWLAESHVFHLNGSVEPMTNSKYRSQILLETDPSENRQFSVEENKAFNHAIWCNTFVIVGLSFHYEIDKYLLKAIQTVQDDVPIGDSRWLILDTEKNSAEKIAERIQKALPRAIIEYVITNFADWVKLQIPEIKKLNIIS